jgi:hypothetical protein
LEENPVRESPTNRHHAPATDHRARKTPPRDASAADDQMISSNRRVMTQSTETTPNWALVTTKTKGWASG